MHFLAKNEGVDHVNIFSRSKLELGRALSNFAYAPITLDSLGSFDSIEGLWFFLKTGDERLRRLSGFAAKSLGSSLPDNGSMGPIVFRNAICIAIAEKVKQHPRIGELLDQCELPLTHYYVFGGTQIPAGYGWLVDAWELIRSSRRQAAK